MGIFHGHQCIVYLCIPITDYKGYKSQFWKLHQVHSRTREKIFMILQDLSLGAISCSLTGCFGTLPPDFLFPTIGILCRFTLSCLQGVILTLEGIPGTNESCLNVLSKFHKKMLRPKEAVDSWQTVYQLRLVTLYIRVSFYWYHRVSGPSRVSYWSHWDRRGARWCSICYWRWPMTLLKSDPDPFTFILPPPLFI